MLPAAIANAQTCDECLDEKPSCPQDQEPTCQGGEWVCPEPLCGDYERRACEDEYCGTFDESTCECYMDEGGCGGGCNPSERDRCYEECGYTPYCWDEELCYCYAYPDVTEGPKKSRSKAGAGKLFLGSFPPRITSCEEARHTPTSLDIWYLSGIRRHTGEDVADPTGYVVGSGWGISQQIQWTVYNEEGDQMKEDGMRASEYLDILEANPIPQINLNRTVGVDGDGIFYDVYALLGHWPGLQVGNYSLARQRIEVSQRHDGNRVRHPVLNHCVRMTHDDISTGPCWRWGY